LACTASVEIELDLESVSHNYLLLTERGVLSFLSKLMLIL